MTESPENYLFGGLEQAFEDHYKAAIEALTQIRNKELLAMARGIVQRSQVTSDEVTSQQGPRQEGDTLIITKAAFEYGDMIETGETVIKKPTPWLDYQQHEVAGRPAQLAIRLESIEFVKSEDDGLKSRPGPVILQGKLTDARGIAADFPLARLIQNPDGKVGMYYSFSSPIRYDTEDYKNVESMIETMNQRYPTK